MIMSGYDSWEVRFAWQIARQVRGCPPDQMVLAISPDDCLLAHLEICPFCRDLHRMGASAEEEFELSRHLVPIDEGGSTVPIRKGQVRSLQQSLAGWGPKKLFYNPPLVLVLDQISNPGNAVKVAQVYDDPRLMGPGDIMIGEGLFAETWNSYTLRQSYLDSLVATIPDDVLRKVIELEAKDITTLDEYKALKAFRRLELQVGAYFAMRAVSELMSQQRPNLGEGLFEAFSEEWMIIEQAGRKNPAIVWPCTRLPLLEELALARFPDDQVPLAASSEQKAVSVNVLRTYSGKSEVDFYPSIAVISIWRDHENGILIGGRIVGPLMTEAELFARLELPDGSLAEPAESFIVADSGHFRVFFPDRDAGFSRDDRLLLLVLTR